MEEMKRLAYRFGAYAAVLMAVGVAMDMVGDYTLSFGGKWDPYLFAFGWMVCIFVSVAVGMAMAYWSIYDDEDIEVTYER